MIKSLCYSISVLKRHKGGVELNKNKLESVMKLYGDTGTSLSIFLGIARSTFSAKINETKGAEFTQREIFLIKKKYNLNAAEIEEIFFNKEVSEKDSNRKGDND